MAYYDVWTTFTVLESAKHATATMPIAIKRGYSTLCFADAAAQFLFEPQFKSSLVRDVQFLNSSCFVKDSNSTFLFFYLHWTHQVLMIMSFNSTSTRQKLKQKQISRFFPFPLFLFYPFVDRKNYYNFIQQSMARF